MSATRSVSAFVLSLTILLFVPRTANSGMPAAAPPHCYTGHSCSGTLNPMGFASHSLPFRKAAEVAWRATQNGDAPFEAGFSINNDGSPGKLQLSLFAASHAATHLSIASDSSALGTLHVHNRFGEPTPSPGDIESAKLLRKTVFVESRAGLYSIDPDGNVLHVFPEEDWFSKRCGKIRVRWLQPVCVRSQRVAS
jgi:hypothetical protein